MMILVIGVCIKIMEQWDSGWLEQWDCGSSDGRSLKQGVELNEIGCDDVTEKVDFTTTRVSDCRR